MLIPNAVLTTGNPIIRGLYVQSYDQGEDFPPPRNNFRITDDDSQRVTDEGDKRITDN